jgi:hypothetical protein
VLAPLFAVTVTLNVPAATLPGSFATIWLFVDETRLGVVLLNTTVGTTLVGSNPDPISVT